MKKISVIIVILAAIASFFINFETTTSRKAELEDKGLTDLIELKLIEKNMKSDFDIIPYLVSNMPDKYNENNDLSFTDGIKNGSIVIASYARDVVVGFLCDYISGFYDKGIIMKIIWGVFGLFIEIIKNAFLCVFGTIALIFKLLFQKGSISYYIGYIISLLVSLSILGKAVEEN